MDESTSSDLKLNCHKSSADGEESEPKVNSEVVDSPSVVGVQNGDVQIKKKKRKRKKKNANKNGSPTVDQTSPVTALPKNTEKVKMDDTPHKVDATSKKKKKQNAKIVSTAVKKMKPNSNDFRLEMSDERLKAYGFNPKKFKNKIKYGKAEKS